MSKRLLDISRAEPLQSFKSIEIKIINEIIEDDQLLPKVAGLMDQENVIGDARYARDNSDRMYLHAYQLAFSLYDEHYCYQQLPKIGLWFTRTEIVHTIERLGDLSKLKWPSPMAKAVHAL